MTDVRSASTAGSSTGPQVRVLLRGAALPVICCLSVAAVFGATLLSPVAPAGGDAVATLQAEAAQLSQKMLLEQMQISGYQQQQAAALAQEQADQQQLATTQAAIAGTRRQIARDMAELQQAAVKAYVDGGTAADGTNVLFSADPSGGAGAVYEQVLTGDVSTVVDRLQSDRRTLHSEWLAEQQLATQAHQAATQAQALLTDAQTTEQTLQQQSTQVNGQLAAAIAQQQAAEAAAAAAAAQARAAAQAAAQQRAASNASTGVGAPVATTAGAPVLNAFLTCVVTKESSGNYQAVSPTGQYMGAFQFSQPTWNEAALLAGRPTLVGVKPNQASPTDQDLLAIALYKADGEQPWYDPCRSGF